MEGEDAAEQIEVFGVHRLALAPATRSGYVGVRPTKSKRRAWQAWVHIRARSGDAWAHSIPHRKLRWPGQGP